MICFFFSLFSFLPFSFFLFSTFLPFSFFLLLFLGSVSVRLGVMQWTRRISENQTRTVTSMKHMYRVNRKILAIRSQIETGNVNRVTGRTSSVSYFPSLYWCVCWRSSLNLVKVRSCKPVVVDIGSTKSRNWCEILVEFTENFWDYGSDMGSCWFKWRDPT